MVLKLFTPDSFRIIFEIKIGLIQKRNLTVGFHRTMICTPKTAVLSLTRKSGKPYHDHHGMGLQ